MPGLRAKLESAQHKFELSLADVDQELARVSADWDAALDSVADLEETRPSWVQSLRPRLGVDNRIPEFIEEALAAVQLPEGLVGVLMRVPKGASEHLAVRLARSARGCRTSGTPPW